MRWLDGMTDWIWAICTWIWAILGVGDGQGSLACGSPWCLKESDTTEQPNWTEQMKAKFRVTQLRKEQQ